MEGAEILKGREMQIFFYSFVRVQFQGSHSLVILMLMERIFKLKYTRCNTFLMRTIIREHKKSLRVDLDLFFSFPSLQTLSILTKDFDEN